MEKRRKQFAPFSFVCTANESGGEGPEETTQNKACPTAIEYFAAIVERHVTFAKTHVPGRNRLCLVADERLDDSRDTLGRESKRGGGIVMKLKNLWLAGGLAATLLVAGCGAQTTTTGAPPTNTTPAATANQTTSSQVGPAVGRQAPSFNLQLLDGNGSVSLAGLLAKGKPILLNAWASWCPPCQMETPDLVQMSQKYKGQIQFIGVDMTTQEQSVQNAVAFVNKYKIPYPVLADPQGLFMNAYALQGFPTTFILDSKGKILNVEFGMMTKSQMQKVIENAIASSK